MPVVVSRLVIFGHIFFQKGRFSFLSVSLFLLFNFEKLAAVRLGLKFLKHLVWVRISVVPHILMISLTVVRNSNGSHGAVGRWDKRVLRR